MRARFCRWRWPCITVAVGLMTLFGPGEAVGLEWQEATHFRHAALPAPEPGKPGFKLVNPDLTGVLFTNHLSDAKAAENQIRLNGSGVALGDIDGDGWCDIYLCGLDGGNSLFRNLGNWRFEEITSAAGVACAGQYSTGATLADLDGDGDLDLLVNGVGTGTKLFLNQGEARFLEVPDSGLLRRFGATTSALADIDGDGLLDLYVANYRTTTIRTTGFALLNVGGKRIIRPEDRQQLEYTPDGRVLEHGEPDILYHNEGGGRFRPLNWTDGTFLDENGRPLTQPPFDWGLAAMFRDLNGDGFPDLYVCNDFHSTDKIWMNNGKGQFRAIPTLALRNTTTFSMTVDVGDLNRDGLDDIFVADMLSRRHDRRMMQLAATDPYTSAVGVFENRPQFDRNTLHLNRGDGTYAEIAQYAGLAASEWTWSAILLDVDLDGYEDLLCTTGHMFDTQDLDAEARIQAKGPWRRDLIPQKLLLFPRMQQAKVAFRNRGDLTFESSGSAWGFDQVGVAHGMALADLDNDGDLDVVVNNLNGAAGLYRNESPAPRLAVRLKGLPPNTRGVGARIRVTGGLVPQSQEMQAGGRYLSSDDSMRVFAAGYSTNLLNLEVLWRNGARSIVQAKPNTIYEIDEKMATAEAPTSRVVTAEASQSQIANRKSKIPPLFADVSALLNHTHHDELFDDFARQPLLPRKFSQLGPGMAWFDVNGDGWDDLIVGSGRGGKLAVFVNDGRGGFNRSEGGAFSQTVTRDQTGLLGWRQQPGQTSILAGSANYEDGLTNGALVRRYEPATKSVGDFIPGQASSCGPLAMADLDGDGDLDLFVGGRCGPGRWPASVSSFLYRNQNGRFEIDRENSGAFSQIGLVSGALFTDWNGDGAADLVLACEWGPVRVFTNQKGRLVEETQNLGLDSYAGWWNGIAAGDFDGDGRLDLVASNWGLNSQYQSAFDLDQIARANKTGPAAPPPLSNSLLLYFSDLDRNGVLDLIEAHFDDGLKKLVPRQSLTALAEGLPSVRERFPSFAAYNQADVFEIGGEALRTIKPLRATWLATTVFLNRGSRFEPVVLPPEAQFTPAFGVCVADFDGDGTEDIFLSQNFFEVQPTASRQDAGRGLLLRGDGRGSFSPMTGAESGLAIYGEGRGAASADFDGDGRVDLAVAQNGAATKLYQNRIAKPGLRVRLHGPPGNPLAIGTSLRLVYPERRGPLREIQAGSGYWSQDSAVAVLGKTGEPAKVWVRWPGGAVVEAEIPARATEIDLSR